MAAQAPPERESARVATADERRSFVAVDMDVVSENGGAGQLGRTLKFPAARVSGIVEDFGGRAGRMRGS